MAHHKSAIKRIRQTAKRRLANRYYAKTTRNAIRDLRASKELKDAETKFPKVVSLLDRLAKRGTIHYKKAANLKSKLAAKVASLKK